MNRVHRILAIGVILWCTSCERPQPAVRPDLVKVSGARAPSGEFYFNQKHEFTIMFPKGWKIKRSIARNTVIKAVFRDSQNRLAQVSIAAYELPDEATTADSQELTADLMWQAFKEGYPDLSLRRHSSGDTKLRSRRAVWNIIEVDAPPQVEMFAKHLHFIEGRYLYRITLMTDHDKTFFDFILPTMEESVATFAFGL
jgi:hypothetical protein